YSATTWLYLPKVAEVYTKNEQDYFFACGESYIAVKCLQQAHIVKPEKEVIEQISKRAVKARLETHNILISPGEVSGFAIEVASKADFKNLQAFSKSIKGNIKLSSNELDYQSSNGNLLKLHYQKNGLRAKGSINGEALDYEKWADGGVYKSPYVSLKNSKLSISDGKEGYSIEWKNGLPVYKTLK
ncbi:MAG: hypothetical protein AAGI07_19710, partial [Bacteroidota bacterium]